MQQSKSIWKHWLEKISPPPPTPKLTEDKACEIALNALELEGKRGELVNDVWRSIDKNYKTTWGIWTGGAPKGSGYKVEIDDDTAEVRSIVHIPR